MAVLLFSKKVKKVGGLFWRVYSHWLLEEAEGKRFKIKFLSLSRYFDLLQSLKISQRSIVRCLKSNALARRMPRHQLSVFQIKCRPRWCFCYDLFSLANGIRTILHWNLSWCLVTAFSLSYISLIQFHFSPGERRKNFPFLALTCLLLGLTIPLPPSTQSSKASVKFVYEKLEGRVNECGSPHQEKRSYLHHL